MIDIVISTTVEVCWWRWQS